MAKKPTIKKKTAKAAVTCEMSEAVYALVQSDNTVKKLEKTLFTQPVIKQAQTTEEFKSYNVARKKYEQQVQAWEIDLKLELKQRDRMRQNVIALIPAANTIFLTQNGKYAVAHVVKEAAFGQQLQELVIVPNDKQEHLTAKIFL